jgi:hypothetical protein
MNDESSKEFDQITELGKARSDEYTEKLLAFVQDLEASAWWNTLAACRFPMQRLCD